MSEQPEEIQPEKTTTDDLGASIPKIPWSEIGQEFVENWGRLDPTKPTPEDVEVLGTKGSGKTLWAAKAMQERVLARPRAARSGR